MGIRGTGGTHGDGTVASIGLVTTPATRLPIDVSAAPALRHARLLRWWHGGWPPLVAAVACTGAYAVLVVLPYYVNGLDRLPLGEVAPGLREPQDLWPHTQGGWAWFSLAGAITVYAGPALAVATLAWAAVRTRQGIAAGDLRRTAPALLAAVLALGTLGWLLSPAGWALMAWFLD